MVNRSQQHSTKRLAPPAHVLPLGIGAVILILGRHLLSALAFDLTSGTWALVAIIAASLYLSLTLHWKVRDRWHRLTAGTRWAIFIVLVLAAWSSAASFSS
ncbi:hypothetical protein [Streptomyces hygroscopicus]|uniref:hypothetical protein n=1 Tax=Streptomyces hygroscopicus TaxID=1912 RepID=UPI001FCB4B33|nr:hypothetical protein [Streptomyces hygroscopicus]BDH10494.1 hypothetical protein HOK021_16730 [Streptomyces hygroscopicus]